jgi:hypothetical protein
LVAGGSQHQRERRPAGDEMRVHAHLQHSQAAGPVVLPQRPVPLHVAVASEDVVDKHVEPTPITLDLAHELRDGFGILVVDDACDAVAAGACDQLAGFFDRLGPADL